MEKDFHYHFIYSLARLSGFSMEEAEIVAFSSQFVDDNNEGQFIIDGKERGFPTKIKTSEGFYHPIMTQSLSISSLEHHIHRYVYMPFHFFPGGEDSVPIKGEKNPYSTAANSKRVNILLEKAFETKDLFRIGIALHTYADTWSHQNFSGFWEDWNSVYPWYKVFKSIAPNIGHAEVGHAPDIVYYTWIDYRFGDMEVDNRKRVMDALKNIYKKLQEFTGKGKKWDELETFYEKIVNTKSYNGRIKANARMVKELLGEDVPRYDKNKWIDEALDIEDDIILKDNFKDKNWFKFQQAAKGHLVTALDILKDL